MLKKNKTKTTNQCRAAMVKGGLQLASGVSTHTGQRKKAGHQKQNKIQNKEIRRLMRIRFIFFLSLLNELFLI